MKKEDIINFLQTSFSSKNEFCLKCYFIHHELLKKIDTFTDKLSPELLEDFQDIIKVGKEYLTVQNYDIIEYIIDFYKSMI